MLYPLSYVRESGKDTLSRTARRSDMTGGKRMTTQQIAPILSLNETFPDSLFLLRHPPTARYGCFCHDGVHGLACFSDEAGAKGFGAEIGLPGMTIEAASFDEAREIAKARPLPVVAVMLLDDLGSPRIHFVR